MKSSFGSAFVFIFSTPHLSYSLGKLFQWQWSSCHPTHGLLPNGTSFFPCLIGEKPTHQEPPSLTFQPCHGRSMLERLKIYATEIRQSPRSNICEPRNGMASVAARLRGREKMIQLVNEVLQCGDSTSRSQKF